jgi:superfamily II DNA/RNA helicase
VRCEVVTGGRDIVLQGQALAKKPHVIVATPGRLADHLRASRVTLENLRFVVLDEADRLLDGPYDEDVSVE